MSNKKKGLPESAYYAQFPGAAKALEQDVETDDPVPPAKLDKDAKPVDVRELITGQKSPQKRRTVIDDTFDED